MAAAEKRGPGRARGTKGRGRSLSTSQIVWRPAPWSALSTTVCILLEPVTLRQLLNYEWFSLQTDRAWKQIV